MICPLLSTLVSRSEKLTIRSYKKLERNRAPKLLRRFFIHDLPQNSWLLFSPFIFHFRILFDERLNIVHDKLLRFIWKRTPEKCNFFFTLSKIYSYKLMKAFLYVETKDDSDPRESFELKMTPNCTFWWILEDFFDH